MLHLNSKIGILFLVHIVLTTLCIKVVVNTECPLKGKNKKYPMD